MNPGVQLASSKDGGITHRELVRQEFILTPTGRRGNMRTGPFGRTRSRI